MNWRATPLDTGDELLKLQPDGFHLLSLSKPNDETHKRKKKRNQFLCFFLHRRGGFFDNQIHFLQIANALCCNHSTFIFRHSLSVNHDSRIFYFLCLWHRFYMRNLQQTFSELYNCLRA